MCAVSCVTVKYTGDETFDPCRTECGEELSKLDLSAACYLLNETAQEQYDYANQRVNELGYEAAARFGGCGCLLAKISSDGRIVNLKIAYSTSENAVAFLSAGIRQIEVDSQLEKCLVDAELAIAFGGYSNSWIVQNGRRDLIYSIHEYISQQNLTPASNISCYPEIG